jgi:hypothetical protein
VKKLEYSTIHGISVYVPFYDRVTIIGGDSSTGKSFIKETAQSHYNDINKPRIEVFDYNHPIDLAVLKALKNRLIIIDNADLLLDGNRNVVDHINRDNSNQYLLFMRSHNGVEASTDNYAELRQEGNRIEAIYEYR